MEDNKKASVEVVDIQFRPGQKVYYFAPAGLALQAGDHVIIDTARGPEFGYVTSGNHTIAEKDIISPLRSVLRIATKHDEAILAQNQQTEKQAHDVCQEKIAEYALDMQLVSAECAFDGSKILFFFTADERVDFRELVKALAATFHTRIELRQIGVRDKAKMVGGLGICGRPFCCASFLDDFQPVSIKMAKTQSLSLNPTKISGTCGRLMCCLKYEQDAYEDLLRNAPKAESLVDTPDGRGTVVEVDLLRSRVKVRMENSPETVSIFSNDDIAVLRSGKAKKTDAPIPMDYAPVSGATHEKKVNPAETEPVPDSIRFHSNEESIAQETQSESSGATAGERKKNPRRKNRKHHNRKQGADATPQPTSDADTPAKKANPSRRNFYRHKPNKNKGQKQDE